MEGQDSDSFYHENSIFNGVICFTGMTGTVRKVQRNNNCASFVAFPSSTRLKK